MKSSVHFIRLLPLLAFVSVSSLTHPVGGVKGRSVASESNTADHGLKSSHPKYEARAGFIDKSKITTNSELDLTYFAERGEDFRTRLLEVRDNYKVTELEPLLVQNQKNDLQSLVQSLVELEVDFSTLKEKKAFENMGEQIAFRTINELKTTLESLLISEEEHESFVLKSQAAKIQETKTEEERICELEEKNKALNLQLEQLLAEQKKILESMLGMNHLLTQMQQQQQSYHIPSWLMAGSLVNPQFQYPLVPAPTIIPETPLTQATDQLTPLSGPELGQLNYEQQLKSPHFELSPVPSYLGQDPRFLPHGPVNPGIFGQSDFSFNFSSPFFNQGPL